MLSVYQYFSMQIAHNYNNYDIALEINDKRLMFHIAICIEDRATSRKQRAVVEVASTSHKVLASCFQLILSKMCDVMETQEYTFWVNFSYMQPRDNYKHMINA